MKMTIAECLNLEVEISGNKNNEGNVLVKGLLNESLNLKTKYWLNKLVIKLLSEKTVFNNSRDTLIKELGEEMEDGSFTISIYINEGDMEIVNPNYITFTIQTEELLNQEIDIDQNAFNVDDFDFTSEYSYPTFMEKCLN